MIRNVIAGIGAFGLVLGLAGTAVASTTAAKPATVSPTVLYDEQGTAGWYTQGFATDFQQADAKFTLTNIATKLPDDATGAQLCNSEDADSVQVGAVATSPATITTPALYTIGFGYGALPTSTTGPTGDGDNCTGNSFLVAGEFTGMVNDVPAGHTLQVELQVVKHEFSTGGPPGVFFRAEDVTDGLTDFNQFEPFSSMDVTGPFTEAGYGVSADMDTLSAPAVNDLTDFSDVTATSTSDVTDGLAEWNAVQVDSSEDGQAPALMAPTALTGSAGGKVCTLVWINGYWGKWFDHHKKRNWHKGHWKSVCKAPQGATDAFSVDAGSLVGP